MGKIELSLTPKPGQPGAPPRHPIAGYLADERAAVEEEIRGQAAMSPFRK